MTNLIHFTAIRFVFAVLTVVTIVCHPYLPEKRLVLLPSPAGTLTISGPEATPGGASVSWIDEEQKIWRCHDQQSVTAPCGMSLHIGTDSRGLDLTPYHRFQVSIRYSGPATTVRMLLRNFDPAYSKAADEATSKLMFVHLRTDAIESQEMVLFNEFRVAQTWLSRFDIPRHSGAPQFDNVTRIGFDFVDPGVHVAQIERLEAWGPRVTGEALYLLLLLGWILLVLWEGLVQLYISSRNSSSKTGRLVAQAPPSYQRFELGKEEFENDAALIDPMTGTFNREGIARFVDKLFNNDPQRLPIGLLVFDIDHLKRVNDRWGHDHGDRILAEFGEQLLKNIRLNDFLGRWEGEQFVLVCPRTSRANLLTLAEKLRQAIHVHTFTAADAPLKVTVSIGGSVIGPEGLFEDLLKRSEDSLRRAKKAGRNCTVVD